MKKIFLLGAFFGLLTAAPAFAQHAGTEAQREACQEDAYKWCPHEVPDHEEVAACLRKNMRWISPACQAQFPENAKKGR